MLRSTRPFSRLLLLLLVLTWLPSAPIRAAAVAAPEPPAGGALSDPPPAQPVPLVSQPIPKLLPPGLALELAVSPDPIAIGETATLSVMVTNRAPYPAEALEVTVPPADGALAVPGPGTLGPRQGWRWTTRLDGNSSTVLTSTLRLVGNPSGDALVLTAQATAIGLATPSRRVAAR